MADAKLPALTEISTFAKDDYLYIVDTSDTTDDATGSSRKSSLERIGGFLSHGICQGRLTLESGVPVSSSDQTSKTSVYFTPYNGNRIAVYDGTRWKYYSFSEITLALGTLTSGKNYDVFIYDNSGTLTLELSAAWTNDTTRADALTTQDGVYVKSGAATRRYLGTIRTTSTTTTEDSRSNRLVWNLHNQIVRNMYAVDTTDSWTYTTATWRSTNNSTTNRVAFLIGIAGCLVTGFAKGMSHNGAEMGRAVGIGLDSTSANSATVVGGFAAANGYSESTCFYRGIPDVGYHYLQQLEYSEASGTTTWYGDAGRTFIQTGMVAETRC